MNKFYSDNPMFKHDNWNDYTIDKACDALAVWEVIQDDQNLRKFFTGHNGIAQMRMIIVSHVAPLMSDVYCRLLDQIDFDGSFDLEFIPAFLDIWLDQHANIKPDQLTLKSALQIAKQTFNEVNSHEM